MSKDKSHAEVHAARARYKAASLAHESLQRARNDRIRTAATPWFDERLSALEEQMLEAKLALDGSGDAYNRSASDLEGLRTWVERQVTALCEAFSALPEVPPEPALGGYDTASLDAYVVARAERERIGVEHTKARAALPSGASILAAARAADVLLRHARKAANLPNPPPVVTSVWGAFLNGKHLDSPARCDELMAEIATQREPKLPREKMTREEFRLREIRHDREKFEAELAEQALLATLTQEQIAFRAQGASYGGK